MLTVDDVAGSTLVMLSAGVAGESVLDKDIGVANGGSVSLGADVLGVAS